MGEIADMILDGTLDEETGEYIGDKNLKRFGDESPGFPISYERERREGREHVQTLRQAQTQCPICGKRVKKAGLAQHTEAKHGEGQ